jgi:hypothetical protein
MHSVIMDAWCVLYMLQLRVLRIQHTLERADVNGPKDVASVNIQVIIGACTFTSYKV